MSTEEIRVFVKVTGSQQKLSISILPTATIYELKQKIEQNLKQSETPQCLPVSQQRIIFSGHVLSDEKTLESYSIKNDLVVHLVRSTPKPQTSSQPTQQPPQQPSTSTQHPNPFPFLGAAQQQGGQNPFSNLGAGAQLLQQNPNVMRDLLNLPMTQQLLQNPDFMRQVLMSNPQLRQLVENNPDIGRALSDPEMLRRVMEISRNPDLYRETMRSADLALNQIESLPGGYSALRQFYSEVQEPLLNATSSNPWTSMNSGGTQDTTSDVSANTLPNAPIPNIWGSPSTQAPPRTTNSPPTTNNSNSNPNVNPFGDFSGAPFGMDMNTVQSMMQNPAVRSMVQDTMSQMMANPQFFESMVQANPQLGQMMNSNPALRNMMANPHLWNLMSNPDFLQLSQDMQRQLGDAAPFGASPLASSLFGGGSSSASAPPTSASPARNPFASLATQATPQPTQTPEEQYRIQLKILADMEFQNTELNISLLQQEGGNVNRVIDKLLSMFS